jgi:hypothetical protein
VRNLLSGIVNALTGNMVKEVSSIAKAYALKEISPAEFQSRVEIAARTAEAKIEESWAKAASEMSESAHQTLRSSPVLQRAYAVAILTQLFVLVWYQLGAPAYLVLTGTAWPSPGATVEWAYALLAAMLGAGMIFKR